MSLQHGHSQNNTTEFCRILTSPFPRENITMAIWLGACEKAVQIELLQTEVDRFVPAELSGECASSTVRMSCPMFYTSAPVTCGHGSIKKTHQHTLWDCSGETIAAQ